jgi:hypothetical protein
MQEQQIQDIIWQSQHQNHQEEIEGTTGDTLGPQGGGRPTPLWWDPGVPPTPPT